MKKHTVRWLALAGAMVLALISCKENDDEDDTVVNYVTVTFESNGGSSVASQTVEKGDPATKPAAPTRDGYVFDNWYTDNGTFTTIFSFKTLITADITLYASWKEIPAGGYFELSAAEAAAKITSFADGSTNTVMIKVIGEMTSEELRNIAEAIGKTTTPLSLDLSGTTGLTSISFTYGGTRYDLDSYTYDGFDCSNLVSVVIPEGVTYIDSGAFFGCNRLTSVTIPDSVTNIGLLMFGGCTSLTSVDIPNSVTTIDNGAFSGCASLTSVNIPDGVTTIGEQAFYGCTSLTSLNIPDGVTSIGEWAFSACKSLSSVNIPDSVTTIGDNAFRDCGNIESVVIGAGVTRIGQLAFNGDQKIASAIFKDTSTWYVTEKENYTDGTQVDVSNPATNGINLGAAKGSTVLYNGYWYKQ